MPAQTKKENKNEVLGLRRISCINTRNIELSLSIYLEIFILIMVI